MARGRWPDEQAEKRVRAALSGPSAEVLRIIAAQPHKSSSNPPDPAVMVPVPGR